MIKRFIFTILLLLLNVASIAILLSDPFNLEKLFIFGFFIFLLIFHIISWTKSWQNILHSNIYLRAVTIFAITFVTSISIYLSFKLYRGLSTGEMLICSRGGGCHLINEHSDPWLFWTEISLGLCFIICIIGGGVSYWIKNREKYLAEMKE